MGLRVRKFQPASSSCFAIAHEKLEGPLTRAREWDSELRGREEEGGGGQNLPLPAISAPVKARITKLLWKVDWLKNSISCNLYLGFQLRGDLFFDDIP